MCPLGTSIKVLFLFMELTQQSGGVCGISADESKSSKPKKWFLPKSPPCSLLEKAVLALKLSGRFKVPLEDSNCCYQVEVKSRPAVNQLHLQKQYYYHWIITDSLVLHISEEALWRSTTEEKVDDDWGGRDVCVTQKSKDYVKLESRVYGCCETFILIFPLLIDCLRGDLVLAIIFVDKKASWENMQV